MNFEFTGSGTKERIDKFLCEKMDGFTRSHIQRLIENGRVTVGGLVVPAKYVPKNKYVSGHKKMQGRMKNDGAGRRFG